MVDRALTWFAYGWMAIVLVSVTLFELGAGDDWTIFGLAVPFRALTLLMTSEKFVVLHTGSLLALIVLALPGAGAIYLRDKFRQRGG